MRLSPRAVVTSVAACALAVGWMGISDAAAANQPAAARHIVVLHDGTRLTLSRRFRQHVREMTGLDL